MYAFRYRYSQKHYLSSIIHLKEIISNDPPTLKKFNSPNIYKLPVFWFYQCTCRSCQLDVAFSLICFEESKQVLNHILLRFGSNSNLIWLNENQRTYHFWQLEGASFFNFFSTKEARTRSSVSWSISGASGFWNSTIRNYEFLSLFFFCVASKQA